MLGFVILCLDVLILSIIMFCSFYFAALAAAPAVMTSALTSAALEALAARQKELELQIRYLVARKSRSGTPSGLHTPKHLSGSSQEHSAGHYFDELKKHFYSKNNKDQYGISLTRYACSIHFGRNHNPVYNTSSSPVDVRNLYIMLSVCGYDVTLFLKKLNADEFGVDFIEGKITPDKYSERSTLYAPIIGK